MRKHLSSLNIICKLELKLIHNIFMDLVKDFNRDSEKLKENGLSLIEIEVKLLIKEKESKLMVIIQYILLGKDRNIFILII